MTISFFDLKRQYSSIQDEVEKNVIEILRSGLYIEGPAVKDFEKNMAEYLGVKHVITCGNGTDALKIALQACGVKAGDEVITTSFTFFATAEAISGIGAIPVFADINPSNFNIDIHDVKRKITKHTKAILAVHIFGLPADMQELNDIGSEYGIPVIEDACQAIGAQYKNKKTGTLGTIGCFSFYPTKNLGGCGDGGMITTDDDNLAQACTALKSHAAGKPGAAACRYLYHEKVEELDLLTGNSLHSPAVLYDPCKYYNYFIAHNSRLDSIQAALLLVKLKHLDEFNQKRSIIAKAYCEKLANTPLILPQYQYPDRISCWHQYAVLAPDKEALIHYLDEKGIGTGSFYPIPLHLQKAFKNLNYKEGCLPIAENVCSHSVCLPIFPELENKELNYIIDAIVDFYN